MVVATYMLCLETISGGFERVSWIELPNCIDANKDSSTFIDLHVYIYANK